LRNSWHHVSNGIDKLSKLSEQRINSGVEAHSFAAKNALDFCRKGRIGMRVPTFS